MAVQGRLRLVGVVGRRGLGPEECPVGGVDGGGRAEPGVAGRGMGGDEPLQALAGAGRRVGGCLRRVLRGPHRRRACRGRPGAAAAALPRERPSRRRRKPAACPSRALRGLDAPRKRRAYQVPPAPGTVADAAGGGDPARPASRRAFVGSAVGAGENAGGASTRRRRRPGRRARRAQGRRLHLAGGGPGARQEPGAFRSNGGQSRVQRAPRWHPPERPVFR